MCRCYLINEAPLREQFSGPSVCVHCGFSFFSNVYTLVPSFCFSLFFLALSKKSSCVVFFLFVIFFFFLMVFSAALNRRPYDCMHSAGEDDGLERVFINHHTNTNCVAEKRSTAANHVSNYMAQFYCLLHVIYYPR